MHATPYLEHPCDDDPAFYLCGGGVRWARLADRAGVLAFDEWITPPPGLTPDTAQDAAQALLEGYCPDLAGDPPDPLAAPPLVAQGDPRTAYYMALERGADKDGAKIAAARVCVPLSPHGFETMARAIQPTPVLTGEDAQSVLRSLSSHCSRTEAERRRERARELLKQLNRPRKPGPSSSGR